MKFIKFPLFIISILSLTFILTIFSSSVAKPVFYAEPLNSDPVYCSSIEEALELVSNGGRLTLLEDISIESPITLCDNVLLDIGGHCIVNQTQDAVFVFSGGSLEGYGKIISSGPIASNTADNAGKIHASGYGIHIDSI